MQTILVTGATGNIGREVVAQLRQRKDCRVRALTRKPDSADLGPGVDVFGGDLTAPESLDASVTGADAVFLVWTAPLDAAAPAIARIAPRVGRIVLLTSPHRTPHPFFQQPNPSERCTKESNRRSRRQARRGRFCVLASSR